MMLIKAYNVAVQSHPVVLMFGKNKNQVRMKTFNALRHVDNISFKEFLKLKPHISQTVMTHKHFGKKIKINPYNSEKWQDAYFISHQGNTVQYAMPNCDRIVNAHELDCDLTALTAKNKSIDLQD